MQPPNRVLTVYEFQRFVFDEAVALGWRGRQPLLLADAKADQAFQEAFRFLKSLEASKTKWENRQRDVPAPGTGFALREGHEIGGGGGS